MDNYPVSAATVARFNGISPSNLARNYKSHLSDFEIWDQRDHAQDWLLYTDNLGEQVCIDEVALSQGELYTVVSNASAACQQGSLIAIIKGTKAEAVKAILAKIPLDQRRIVREVSVDLAANMEKIARESFPYASVVSDRFHVQRLCSEAVQDIRIKYRWQAIDEENKLAKKAKERREKYYPQVLANGDTKKQLLARSRYLLFKTENQWTTSQKQRAALLFELYPDIHHAYRLSLAFRNIYETARSRQHASQLFFQWSQMVKERNLEPFFRVVASVQTHQHTVLNYFINRTTNALAESLNSKIKIFRSQFRGVKDIPFFLYRLSMLLA